MITRSQARRLGLIRTGAAAVSTPSSSQRRQVIAVFVDDRVDDHPVNGPAFGDDADRGRRGLNPQFFARTAGALFPLSHQHEVFGRFDIQLLAALIADELLVIPALSTDTLFWSTGDNLFHPWQMCG